MPAEGQRFGHQAASIRFWLRADESATSIYHALADGDIVVVAARGNNLTKAGVRYDNEYCLVFRLENGKIREIREYCVSVLTEKALGRLPGAH